MMFVCITTIVAGCWNHDDPAPRTLHFKPGHHTLHLGSTVEVGDKILCEKPNGDTGFGGIVPKQGHGVGTGTGFSIGTFENGKVEINCPTNPQYA